MALGREMKRRAKAAIAPLFFLSLVGYFGWNIVRGDHGLVAYQQRRRLLVQAQADLAKVTARETMWARRVASLQTGHLDLDALDERAREMLTLSDPRDILVPYGKDGRLY